MHHLLRIPLPAPESGLWPKYAARDLDVVCHYLRQAQKQRRCCAEHSASVLGALIHYSRPFTERANPQVNPYPGERQCFLSLAADLGADLRLHSSLLQVRDAAMALSEVIHAPPGRPNTRRFKHPDPRLARITRNVQIDSFRRLASTMRLACYFFAEEMDFRRV
jgi:hypothetical protein